jgi:hypothetical protein
MKEKFKFSLGIALLLLMFSLTSVSAWTSSEFIKDDAKRIEMNSPTFYGKYEISESKWWDVLKVFTQEKVKEVVLEDNSDECSDNCFAIKEVTNLKPMPLIEDVRFYRATDKGWTLWNGFTNWRIEVEEDVDLFKTECIDGKTIIDEKNGTSYTEQICSQVKTGTEKRWLPLDYKKNYEGTYRVKLSGGKKADVVYDWQVKMNGVWSEEWAVWGAVIGVGGVEANITINSPANNSIQYTNPVTTNATANVTGGAYLVNASLNLSVNGGAWEIRNTTDLRISDNGLVSYYTLDETSENIAYDSLGVHNGINSGATINQAGKIGTAYDFDGVDDTINATTNYGLSGLNTFSFSAWVNPDVVNKYQGFMSGTDFTVMAQNDGSLFMLIGATGSSTSAGVLSAGTYQFVTFTYDGSNMRIYHNTDLKVTTANSVNIPTGNIILGNDRGIDGRWFGGLMDEVAIWNKALNSTEITALYNSGAGLRPTTTTTTTIFTNTFNAGDVVDFNYLFEDSDGDIGQSETRRFTIDSTAPTINLSYPTALIDYGRVNGTLQLNFTATDTNLDKVWYNYNGTNVTIAGAVSGFYNISNITLTTKKNVTIYANDTAGNVNATTFSWDYKVFETEQEYSPITRAGSVESYALNITLSSGIDLTSGKLIYAGQELTANIYTSGLDRRLLVANFETPLYTIDTNASFYWDLTITGGSVQTQNNTQLVRAVLIDNCSTHTYKLFNLSLFDERTKSSLRGDIEINYQLLNKPTYGVINSVLLNLKNVSNSSICSGINLSGENIAYSAEIRYTSEGYASEFYNIQRADIGTGVQQLKLYDLNLNYSTEFKIVYQDDDYTFVEGAVVQLQRKYISEGIYEIVEAPLTSNEGTAVVHIDLDSNKYKATIVKNGQVLDVFDNLVFKCQSALTGECTQQLLGSINPQNDVNLESILDFAYTNPLMVNDTISLSFSIPSGSPSTVGLVLIQKDQFGNQTLCNRTITSSAGSIECDFDKTIGDSFIELYATKNGELILETTYIVPEDGKMDFLGNNFFIVLVMLLSLVGMAFTSPEWIIINGVITFLIAGSLWLLNGLQFVVGLGALMWLVVASAILIFKIAKQEDR